MRFVITEEEKDQIRDLYDDKWNRFYRCMRRRHSIIDFAVELAIKNYMDLLLNVTDEKEFLNNITYIASDALSAREDFNCVDDEEDKFSWIYNYVSDNWKDHIINFHKENIKKS
jgi:hypothetical protein